MQGVADVADVQPRARAATFAATTTLAVLASVATMAITTPTISWTSAVLFASFALAVFLGERTAFRLPGLSSIFISGETAPLIAVAVVEPSLAVPVALATVFLAPASSLGLRMFNGSILLLSSAAASLVAHAGFQLPHTTGSTFLTGAIATAFVFVLVNVGLVAAYESFVWRSHMAAIAPGLIGSLLATTVVAFPIVSATAWLIGELGPAACPLIFIPLAITQYFHGLYHRKAELTEELADKAQILARTNLQFAAAMVRALDQRDAYTAGHSAAVAVYTRDIAREMGFDDETVRLAHLAGLLHDIGKIGVPGRVLNKTAPLDDEEYELMKSHAAMGAEIVSEVDLYAEIAVLVRYHHERIDGKGYPDRLAGDAIPAISRMISVADTYSAMTTDRPYREGMPTEKAMSILKECRGTQLDSDFTDAFLRILVIADADYQRGKQTDFEVEVAKHQALSQVEAEAVRVNAPSPASPDVAEPVILPAATSDGAIIEVELEREAA